MVRAHVSAVAWPGRVIDRMGGAEPGPTLLVIAGVHGNEPAGVSAARRALAALRSSRCPVAGEVVARAGNVRALAAGRRYLARDLNRQWTADRVAAARATLVAPAPPGHGGGPIVSGEAGPDPPDAELNELVELAGELD